MKFLLLLIILLLSSAFAAEETCSRVAVVNYQEILVDTNSSQKGEGLRFYLEKDAEAKYYLDRYQEGLKTSWENAILGTAGSSMILLGLLSSNRSSSKSFLISGSAFLALNFLVAKTIAHKNERNLKMAVDEYNKRNLPRIQFIPDVRVEDKNNTTFELNIQKDY